MKDFYVDDMTSLLLFVQLRINLPPNLYYHQLSSKLLLYPNKL